MIKMGSFILILLISVSAFSDDVVGLGRPYKFINAIALPSQNVWQDDLDGKQLIKFVFSQKTAGQKPESFTANDIYPKRINSFRFEAPIATEFHFDDVVFDSKSCSKPPEGKIKVSYQGFSHDLQKGESFYLNEGEIMSIDFDLQDWSACSFETVGFKYYLTGATNLVDYPSHSLNGVLENGSEQSLTREIVVPPIYHPFFQYFIKEASISNLDERLAQCQKTVTTGASSTTRGFSSRFGVVYEKIVCPESSKLTWTEQKWLLQNADHIVLTFQDVLVQGTRSYYVPDPSSSKWYVNPDEPVYHYRTVTATSLVLGRGD